MISHITFLYHYINIWNCKYKNFSRITGKSFCIIIVYKMISLQEFLKKYSTISSHFINDFFSLYNRDTKVDDFVIDLDILAKWLKSRKDHLKDTLKSSYVKNYDI